MPEENNEIPNDFVNYKTTFLMNKDNIPKLFLFEHNGIRLGFMEKSV